MLLLLLVVAVVHASVADYVVVAAAAAPMDACMLNDARVGVDDYADVVDASNEVLRNTKSRRRDVSITGTKSALAKSKGKDIPRHKHRRLRETYGYPQVPRL
jgi:hypothetical protein